MISEYLFLLCPAILAYVFTIALFGRGAAKYGAATIHSFWSAWVTITTVLLGWILFAYFAPWKVSENVEDLAPKVVALVIMYSAVILMVLSFAKAIYELRVRHLTRQQIFTSKKLWQPLLLIGTAFFVVFAITVSERLIG